MIDTPNKAVGHNFTHLLDGHARPETDFQDTVGGLQVQQGNCPLIAFKILWSMRHDEAGNSPPKSCGLGELGNDFLDKAHKRSSLTVCQQNRTSKAMRPNVLRLSTAQSHLGPL